VTGLPLSQVRHGGYLAAVRPAWTRKAGCKPALRRKCLPIRGHPWPRRVSNGWALGRNLFGTRKRRSGFPTPTEISAKACSGGLRPPSGAENRTEHGGHRPPLQQKRLLPESIWDSLFTHRPRFSQSPAGRPAGAGGGKIRRGPRPRRCVPRPRCVAIVAAPPEIPRGCRGTAPG